MQSGKAIPFIVKDPSNDTYHLNPQAQALLSSITTPLSVVTVAGLYRTGKSYLLNRVILNRSGGFGVGPTVNPCTKGLWLWGEPLSVGGRTVLVVDTEGLGALDEESNHDMKIFCLAVLLSSNFIYNSVGSIDEPALQTLSLVLNLIASIDTEAYAHRPSFLWVVRDFALQLINERGQHITPSQYLQMALSMENQKEPQKLQLRKTITDAFTERECFTLIKPLIDETKLQALDRVPPEQLRPEFISQTIALRKYILQSLKEVRLGEAALKGSDYLLMCRRFLTAINSGAVPDLKDTWGYIRQEKARQVVEQVRDGYNERLRARLNNKLPMPSNRLSQLLQHLRGEAEQEFLQLSYDEQPNPDLAQFLAASEAQMQRLNAKESRAALSDILRREFEPFQKKLLSGYYSDAASYEQDLRAAFRPTLQERYGERIDLPLLQLDLYTERRIVEGVKAFEKRTRQEATRLREARAEAESGLQNEIRNLNRVFDEERRRMQEEAFELQKKVIVLTNQKQRAEEALQKAKNEEQVETGRLRRRTEQGQLQAEGLQRELIRLQSVNGEQERQLFYLKKELEKEKALSRQKEQHMEYKMGQVERRHSTLLQQLQSNTKAWESEKRQMIGHWQSKQEQGLRERKELSDHLAETAGHLEHERFTTSKLKQEMEALKERQQEELQRFRERCASSAKKDNKAEMESEFLRELQQVRQEAESVSEQLRQSELRVRQLNEQLKLQRSQAEKQDAISSQRIEFQQMENQELRSKIAEINAAYQRIFDSAQSNVAQEAEIAHKRRVTQLETEHANALRDVENDCENRLATAKRELAVAVRERDDAQLQLTLQGRRWEEREKYLLGSVQIHQQQISQLKLRLSHTEQGHAESQREKESFYAARVQQLQAQMEELKRQAMQEAEEMGRRSQETVAFIKQCSDMEKAQFQRRIEEERERRERKVAETAEEWSQRLAQEKEHLQSVINELEGNIQAMKGDFSEQMQNFRSDAEIRIQKVTNSALEERMDLSKTIALLKQEIDITRNTLTSQLEQRTRQYAASSEAMKKELLFECEQQVRAAKEAMDDLESRLDSLKKSNRKSEESNLLLRAQLDREKAAARERDQLSSRRLKQLEERFAEQLRLNTRCMEELNTSHAAEVRKLNEEIERLKEVEVRMQTERTILEGDHEQERTSLNSKVVYMEAKCKRFKDDYEDLLKKFETTVRTLSNQNQQKEMKREMDQSMQRLREEYKSKLAEKQAAVNGERREMQDRVARLQCQNKALRDKIILLETRQAHQSREARYEQSYEQYDKPLQMQPLTENKQLMDRNRSRYGRQ